METNWIKSLRERFSSRKVAAPKGLFEAIQKKMSSQNSTFKRKGVYQSVWLKASIGIAASFIIFLSLGLYINSKKIKEDESVTIVPLKKMIKEPIAKNNLKEKEALTPLLSIKEDELLSKEAVPRNEQVKENTQVKDIDIEKEIVKEETSNKEEIKESEQKTSSNVVKTKETQKSSSYTNPYHQNKNLYKEKNSSKKKKPSLEFNLYGANLNFSGANSNFNATNTSQPITMSSSQENSGINLLSTSDSRAEEDPEVNVRHRFPLKLGATVRFMVIPRLGIETGLFYTHHHTDIMSGDEDGGYKTLRTLNYLGIPVNVGYDIFSSRYVNVYAKVGAEAQFCVEGKSSTDYIVGSTVRESTSESVKDDPQFSITVMPGIQYNFNNFLGVYAEPGIVYYFDNHSGLNTIYKDKKFNFNLNVGLRFTLFDK